MSLLVDLSGNAEWQRLLKAAEEMMPEIPEWDPKNPESLEDWKFKSAQRAGFELCYQVFNLAYRRKK